MNKKLYSLLAVTTLALVGCGTTDDVSDQADQAPVENNEEIASIGDQRSPEDIIKGIKENSGNEDSRPSVSLDLSSGIAWEDGGYKAQLENGSATIGGTVDGSDKLFVIENGEVTEEVEIQEGTFEYTTEKAAGDKVHLAADDRLEVGQTDVDMDDLDRSEEIEFVE